MAIQQWKDLQSRKDRQSGGAEQLSGQKPMPGLTIREATTRMIKMNETLTVPRQRPPISDMVPGSCNLYKRI